MYPSNLTDAQWQRIEKLTPNENRKRKHDLRQVWNILFGKNRLSMEAIIQ